MTKKISFKTFVFSKKIREINYSTKETQSTFIVDEFHEIFYGSEWIFRFSTLLPVELRKNPKNDDWKVHRESVMCIQLGNTMYCYYYPCSIDMVGISGKIFVRRDKNFCKKEKCLMWVLIESHLTKEKNV